MEISLSMEGGSDLDESVSIPSGCSLVVLVENVYVDLQPSNKVANSGGTRQVAPSFKVSNVEVLLIDSHENEDRSVEKVLCGEAGDDNCYITFRQFTCPGRYFGGKGNILELLLLFVS